MVIVNLQPTPLDDMAALRINGQVDEVMKGVMELLNVEVPPFKLKRYFEFDLDATAVRGLADDSSPFDIFRRTFVQETTDDYVLNLGFHGNYEEPDLRLKLPRELVSFCVDSRFQGKI